MMMAPPDPGDTNLLSAGNRSRIRVFAQGRVLLAFDFDGTLAPLGADPDRAFPRAATRELLASVAERYPVAVISGRAVADVSARLGVEVRTVVGNHGIEPSPAMEEAARAVAEWAPQLRDALGTVSGVVVEDKRFSIALHYRAADDHEEARRRIHSAVAGLAGSPRAADGHFVVNVVGRDAPTKGDALRRIVTELAATGSLFAGDDLTDEDAFAVQDPETSLGVRVGVGVPTRAAFHIPSQAEIDQLLRELLDARP
jgi:trehalose 6-phosphate phosphatase